MSRSVAPLGTVGVLVALLLAGVVVGAAAMPAWGVEEEGDAPAAEEHEPAPGISEIGTQNEVSRQHLPPPAEPPPFMRFLNWPLMVVGVVVALIMLLLYLLWQPRFAEERRSRRRR